MNKSEFLFALRQGLSELPASEIKTSLDYYSELIDDHMEEGMSEQEAVSAIGSVQIVIAQILADSAPLKTGTAKRRLSAAEITLLILGSPLWLTLLLAAGILLLAFLILVGSAIFVMFSIDFAFVTCALSGVLGSLVYLFSAQVPQGILLFGLGLICAGSAVLLFLMSKQAAKAMVNTSKTVLLKIKGFFIRKGDVSCI